MLKERLNLIVSEAIGKVRSGYLYLGEASLVHRSTQAERGDFHCCFVFKLAVGASERLALAQDIKTALSSNISFTSMVEDLVVAPPAYLNFLLKHSCLVEVLCQVHREKERYGLAKLGSGKSKEERSMLILNSDAPAKIIMAGRRQPLGPTSRNDPLSFMGYVYARSGSLLRLARQEFPNVHEGKIEAPLFETGEWQELEALFAKQSAIFAPAFTKAGARLAALRSLVVILDSMVQAVHEAVLSHEPERLIRYAYEVASLLEVFCQHIRIGQANRSSLVADLAIVQAARQVLDNTFDLVGFSLAEQL